MKFGAICKKNQAELKSALVHELRLIGYKPIVGDGYIYAQGTNSPVLLTAHMDTVHKEKCRKIYNKNGVLSSPQGIGGDDRCGIYMIMQIITKTNLRPWILFCEDEEIGRVGAEKFVLNDVFVDELSKLKFMIELDRSGSNDAVYYDCANLEFEDFISETTGYTAQWGSYSDISTLAPEAGIAAVNLSCGYYKPHTLDEYVVLKEMFATMDKVVELLQFAQLKTTPQYEYVKAKSYSSWYDYYDDYYAMIEFTYQKNGAIMQGIGEGISDDAAFVDFFKCNPDVCYGDIVDYRYMIGK